MIRLQMSKKQEAILAAIILITTLFFAALYMLPKPEPAPEVDDVYVEPDWFVMMCDGIRAQVDAQAKIEAGFLAQLDNELHGFDKPHIILNPYGGAPLTAVVLFNTIEPMKISIHISGEDEAADISFNFSGYNTRHVIPVYGLYPNKRNIVRLTAVSAGGDEQSTVLSIKTDVLPWPLLNDSIQTDLRKLGAYQPGLNFTFAQKKAAFDAGGDYRWYYHDFGLLTPTLYMDNGNMIIAKGSAHAGQVALLEVNRLGKIITAYYSPYGVHHDIAAIDDGNLLLTGSSPGGTIEDFIYEIDISTGDIIRTLDLKQVLQGNRQTGNPEYSPANWISNNIVAYSEESIIVSGKNQSAIVSLSWPEVVETETANNDNMSGQKAIDMHDTEIKWILADHAGWNQMLGKYLLDQIGDGFEWPYGQYSVEILPDMDNDMNTVDILVFDNGSARLDNDKELQRAISNNEVVEPEPYSRMVHYRINERLMTVEQVRQFGKELGKAYFSRYYGDATLLENGNRLGVFDNHDLSYGFVSSSLVEVDSSGDIVWEAYIANADGTAGFYSYRTERLPLYTNEANDLGIGVAARVFLP